MRIFRADLHIHTQLSPCGDLSMSPLRIISEAKGRELDIIGVTDHNTTKQCGVISCLGMKNGILVLQGAEITTREEVHCLAFFECSDTLARFQDFLDENLPDHVNDPLIFGDQVAVDEEEMIVYTEQKLLMNATRISIEELEAFVHELGGLFIPAHIDRQKNSIYSQLGFLPAGLFADALEISVRSTPEGFVSIHPETGKFPLLTNSDAHYPEMIGRACNRFQMEALSFEEVRMAIRGTNGRRII